MRLRHCRPRIKNKNLNMGIIFGTFNIHVRFIGCVSVDHFGICNKETDYLNIIEQNRISFFVIDLLSIFYLFSSPDSLWSAGVVSD